jgi:hypothetical protein
MCDSWLLAFPEVCLVPCVVAALNIVGNILPVNDKLECDLVLSDNHSQGIKVAQ